MNILDFAGIALSEPMIERLGWVLVHSLWQFTLIAMLSSLITRTLRHRTARMLYGVLTTSLATCFLLAVLTGLLVPITPVIRSEPTSIPFSEPTPLPENTVSHDAFLAERAASEPLPHGTALESKPNMAAIESATLLEKSHSRVSWSDWFQNKLQPWMSWIVAAWCLGVAFSSLRPLLGWRMVRRLRRIGISAVSENVIDSVRQLSTRLRLRSAVQVWQSTLTTVPIVIGCFRPVILLPISVMTSFPPSQLEAILAHELAHVYRSDFVVNLLQVMLETLFFYHPAVWWLSRQVRVEREHCCDDLVVELLGNRVEYGRALLAVEELRSRGPQLALSAADGSMLSRLRRILGVSGESSGTRWPAVFLSMACISTLWGMLLAWHVLAESKPVSKIVLERIEVPRIVTAHVAEARIVEQQFVDQQEGPTKGDEVHREPIAVSQNSEVIPKDPSQRMVSLPGDPIALKAALKHVINAAGMQAEIDEAALKDAGLDTERPVTLRITKDTLAHALRELTEWPTYADVFWQVKGGKVVVTTLTALQARTREHLPEWMKPHYTHGLVADLNDQHEVVSVTTSRIVNDQILAQLKTLPKLRELHIEVTTDITPAGLAHLKEMPCLEKLTLYDVNQSGAGMGDEAIRGLVGAPAIRDLSITTCGTTDAGAKLLEQMRQLTALTISQEGRLTEGALKSIGTLKRLKTLNLSSLVATEKYGRMQFSADGIRQLADLKDLETLDLTGHDVPADTLQFPKLTSLSLGHSHVDDSVAGQVSTLRELKVLQLMYCGMTDAGLRQIAKLPRLIQLQINSSVITDEGIEALPQLQHLQSLTLRAQKVSDKSLQSISRISSLKRLDLDGSGFPGVNPGQLFTGPGLKTLAALPELETLFLTNFGTIQGGFGGFKEFKHLRTLDLMMCGITQAELEILEDLLPDTDIHHATGGGDFGRPKKKRKPIVDGVPISLIKIEGNVTVSGVEIARLMTVRPGPSITQDQIKKDVDAIIRTRRFSSVEPTIQKTDDGNTLVIRLTERPLIDRVDYKGNTKLTTETLETLTGLAAGQPYDVAFCRECARRIEGLYRDKGYGAVTVRVEDDNDKQRANQSTRRTIVFVIDESR